MSSAEYVIIVAILGSWLWWKGSNLSKVKLITLVATSGAILSGRRAPLSLRADSQWSCFLPCRSIHTGASLLDFQRQGREIKFPVMDTGICFPTAGSRALSSLKCGLLSTCCTKWHRRCTAEHHVRHEGCSQMLPPPRSPRLPVT